jgi:4-hydroxy-tetrahydrodipicolinate synthase
LASFETYLKRFAKGLPRKMSAAIDRLKGSIPPLVTPFKGGEVDYDAYARLVAQQIEKGSHGILVNGTTSEPATLTVEERNQLVDVAIATTAKRVPIVAATGSQSLAETKKLTEHAAKAGVDALLIVTPYYTRPPQRGLVAYYLELAKISDLPWMVYHIPGRTAVSVTLDTLKELRSKSPAFVGMKHAVNDLGFVSECLATFGPDFKIFVGLEELSFPMMAVGACGLMNAVGNLCPGVLSDMCEAVWRNDLAAAQALHQRLFEINQAVFFDTNPIAIKYMMKRLGIFPANEHRLPMVPATPELEKRLDAVLRRAGLLEADKAA